MARKAWDPRLTIWVDQVDAHWHYLGIQPTTRSELRLSLVTDLSQALLEGAPVAELLAADPASFAGDVAVAEGVRTSLTQPVAEPATQAGVDATSPSTGGHHRTTTTVVVAGLLGSVVGGVLGIAVGLGLMGWVNGHVAEGSTFEVVLLLTIYAAAALVAAICGGMAVASVCAPSPRAEELGRRATRGLIGSGALATFLTVSFAGVNDYSTTGLVIVAEVALVLGCLVGGLMWAARQGRGTLSLGRRLGHRGSS